MLARTLRSLLLPAAVFSPSANGCGGEEAPAPPRAKAAAARSEQARAKAEAEEAEVLPPPRPNRAPLVRSITFTPGAPSRLDILEAKADVDDADGDEVHLKYTWIVNGRDKLGLAKPRLDLADYPRGTRVAVRVAASDERDLKEVTSDELVVGNASPRFLTSPKMVRWVDGFRMKAEDVDGDTIAWSLQDAPPGMTIDAGGTLRWKGSETDKGGHFDLKVVCTDEEGATAMMEIPLDIEPGKPSTRSSGAEAPSSPAPAATAAPGEMSGPEGR